MLEYRARIDPERERSDIAICELFLLVCIEYRLL